MFPDFTFIPLTALVWLIQPQADLYGVKTADVYMVTYVDLNVPYANSQEKMEELMTAIQFINDISPLKHVALVELPDVPKKSAKRGLADEESAVQTQLWALKQRCDTRFIVPFDVPQVADAKCTRRRTGLGTCS